MAVVDTVPRSVFVRRHEFSQIELWCDMERPSERDAGDCEKEKEL